MNDGVQSPTSLCKPKDPFPDSNRESNFANAKQVEALG